MNLRHRLPVLGVLGSVFAWGILLAAPPTPSKEPPRASQPEQVAASGAGSVRARLVLTQQEMFEVGQPILGEMTISNGTTGWVQIPDGAQMAGNLRLTGPDGKEIEPQKSDLYASARTTQLGPHGFLGLVFDAKELFPSISKPGEYLLAFRSPGLNIAQVSFKIIDAYNPNKDYRMTLDTPGGPVEIELSSRLAPIAIHNLVSLTRTDFFNNSEVPRTEKGVMLAVRGPITTKYQFKFEPTEGEFLAGTVVVESSMSDSGRVNYPTLIILLGPNPDLKGRFTIVGKVTKGLEIAQKLAERPTTGKEGKPPFRPTPKIQLGKVVVAEVN